METATDAFAAELDDDDDGKEMEDRNLLVPPWRERNSVLRRTTTHPTRIRFTQG